MTFLVKICGLSTPDTLDAALDAGADLVGFVFFPPSPRHLDMATARHLGRRVDGRAGKVAVMVDPDDGLLAAIIDALDPDMLQLHGPESPDRVRAVRSRFGLPVMKAVPVADAGDLAKVPAYAPVADRLLFDARPRPDATRPGGLGRPFDWELLAGLDAEVPFLLSGGLDAENVATAVAVTRAPGVDVSSGVERAPGVKDARMITAFVGEARRAAAATDPWPSHGGACRRPSGQPHGR